MKIFYISCVFVFLFGCGNNQESEFQAAVHDPQQVIVALNYAMVSASRIIKSEDRAVLQVEYDNIYNNINLELITDDIRDVLTGQMNLITSQLLDAERRRILDMQHQQAARARTMSYISQAVVAGAALAAQDYTGAAIAMASIGSQLIYTTTAIDAARSSEEFAIRRDVLINLNYMRTHMFSTSHALLQRYEIPDRYRLSERDLNLFLEVLDDPVPDRRYRRLRDKENRFLGYPPIWFYLGLAAKESGELETAKQHFRFYIENHRTILREDPFLMDSLMNYTALLDPRRDRRQIDRHLDSLANRFGTNGTARTFAASMYAQTGNTNKAVDLLRRNIDSGYQVSLSRLLTIATFIQANDRRAANNAFDAMLGEIGKTTIYSDLVSAANLLGKLDQDFANTHLGFLRDVSFQINRPLARNVNFEITIPNFSGPNPSIRVEMQDSTLEFSMRSNSAPNAIISVSGETLRGKFDEFEHIKAYHISTQAKEQHPKESRNFHLSGDKTFLDVPAHMEDALALLNKFSISPDFIFTPVTVFMDETPFVFRFRVRPRDQVPGRLRSALADHFQSDRMLARTRVLAEYEGYFDLNHVVLHNQFIHMSPNE